MKIDKYYHLYGKGKELVLEEVQSAQLERKKGKWIWSEKNASWCCGACDCVFEEIEWRPEYNFCPNCGADMRGEQDEMC